MPRRHDADTRFSLLMQDAYMYALLFISAMPFSFFMMLAFTVTLLYATAGYTGARHLRLLMPGFIAIFFFCQDAAATLRCHAARAA